ncbi:MAG: efflux RND transporter periplasmic adaptor subunit [Alphaproteobacteria bacterium]
MKSSLKNTALLFLLFSILGCFTGYGLYKNNINIGAQATPVFQNALNRAASSLPSFNTYAVSIPALTIPSFETKVTITRRMRYMPDINTAVYWQTLGHITSAAQNHISHSTNRLLSLPGQAHRAAFHGLSKLSSAITTSISATFHAGHSSARATYKTLTQAIENARDMAINSLQAVYQGMTGGISDAVSNIAQKFKAFHQTSLSGWGKIIGAAQNLPHYMLSFFPSADDFEYRNILSYEPAAGNEEAPMELAGASGDENYTFEPVENAPIEARPSFRYEIEDPAIEVEGVLVPQNATVISSSRDGKIASINFDNGDMFQKGDILIEYECEDIKAELAAAEAEKVLTEKRSMRNEKLLKLDIISDIEHLGFKTEDVKAAAQARIVEQRIEQCYIRAAYDGRVTNKLANEHEYTRTDRVLMEVASLDDLEVEFLLPSRWLRWVNVDAPISVLINETGEIYEAIIKRIYGEIDPVSQSIQMTAKLEPYESPLLPGMSGTITLNVERIRAAGIEGFLERPRYAGSTNTDEE